MSFECISFLIPWENHKPAFHVKHSLAFLHSFTIYRYLSIINMKNILKSVFCFCSTWCFWDASMMWLAIVHPVLLLSYEIVWMYRSWFIHFNAADRVGCFLFVLQWAMLLRSWRRVPMWLMPRSGIARWWGVVYSHCLGDARLWLYHSWRVSVVSLSSSSVKRLHHLLFISLLFVFFLLICEVALYNWIIIFDSSAYSKYLLSFFFFF